jgi:hypothetical protein
MENQEVLRELFDEKIKEMTLQFDGKRKFYNRIITGLCISCIAIVLTGAFTVGTTRQMVLDNKKRVDAMDNLYVPAKLYFHVNRTYDLEFQAILAFTNDNPNQLTGIMKEFADFRWSLISAELPPEIVRGVEEGKNK